MAELEIHQFPCLSDNYGVLVHNPRSGSTASIDAPEAGPILSALDEKGWSLTHILTTHHHADHTQGNQALKEKYACRIIGPKAEASKIADLDETVSEGDSFTFGDLEVRVYETPGHTLGHIAYWMPEAKVAFVGDTLFALGCGRVFEGTPAMMWSSLKKLRETLPPETTLYCGHEYTLSNAKFAVTVDPRNESLAKRARDIEALRADGKPTLPTTMAAELETNPFLRPDAPGIIETLSMQGADETAVFAEVRSRKDTF